MEKASTRSANVFRFIGECLKERAIRTGVFLTSFRDCYREAVKKARLVDNDHQAKKHYRRLHGEEGFSSLVSEEGLLRMDLLEE